MTTNTDGTRAKVSGKNGKRLAKKVGGLNVWETDGAFLVCGWDGDELFAPRHETRFRTRATRSGWDVRMKCAEIRLEFATLADVDAAFEAARAAKGGAA